MTDDDARAAWEAEVDRRSKVMVEGMRTQAWGGAPLVPDEVIDPPGPWIPTDVWDALPVHRDPVDTLAVDAKEPPPSAAGRPGRGLMATDHAEALPEG